MPEPKPDTVRGIWNFPTLGNPNLVADPPRTMPLAPPDQNPIKKPTVRQMQFSDVGKEQPG